MSDKKGTRSREGCFNCRQRKRRCDQKKPICNTCTRTGKRCVYPAAVTPLKFVVSMSPGHYTIPVHHAESRRPFLNLTPNDVAIIQPTLNDESSQTHHADGGDDFEDDRLYFRSDDPVHLVLQHPISIQLPKNSDSTTIETGLIQYYVEVISTSRVYVHTDRNLFRNSVVPRIFYGHGPLLSTALAMSAAEWGQNTASDGKNYRALSTRYKVRALEELQQCLWSGEYAEENLLTCVLLASMDISHGSRSNWLRHLQGALALIEDFVGVIDPAVTQMVLRYFRFRFVLMQTTQAGNCCDSYRLFDRLVPLGAYEATNTIDEHMGCSMGLVDIIDQISALSLTNDREDGQRLPKDQLHIEGQRLEHKINELAATTVDADEYLLRSAESFRLATQIYLQLVCFNAAINEPAIVAIHEDLMDCLSTIIVEGQSRRLFPMWPLFIAGCTCSCDEQRKAVINHFTTLDSQWPISNISAVWRALRTVWQARDLSASLSTKQQDWRRIFHRFGWKLSLS